MIWYSCPSGRKNEKVSDCGRAEMVASRLLTRYASAPAAASGVNSPSTSSTPADDLAAGAHVGEDVGVLVAGVGQRVLESGQPLAAPPAERLLQPVGDQHHAQADPQKQQTQVLGAAPAGGVPGSCCRRARSRQARRRPRAGPPAAAGRRAAAPAARAGCNPRPRARRRRRGRCRGSRSWFRWSGRNRPGSRLASDRLRGRPSVPRRDAGVGSGDSSGRCQCASFD